MGIEVNHAISDRAKALIKRAINGWGCESGADVFHAQQAVNRCLGASLARKEKTAENKLADTATCAAKAICSLAEVSLETVRQARADYHETVRQARADYHENIQGMADDLQPFSLTDLSIHTAKTVEAALENRAQAFQSCLTC